MEVNEARRLKALERGNTELKKMLADSRLENRVLRFVNEEYYEPGPQKADSAGRDGRAAVRFRPAYDLPPSGRFNDKPIDPTQTTFLTNSRGGSKSRGQSIERAASDAMLARGLGQRFAQFRLVGNELACERRRGLA